MNVSNGELVLSAALDDVVEVGYFSRSQYHCLQAGLLSKQFLILTGLSGSGKTQLARLLSKWLCSRVNSSLYELLEKAATSDGFLENYDLLCVNNLVVEVINKRGSAKTIIPLPTNVIFEWYHALKNGEIEEGKDPKESRHIIGALSAYQKYIHGFYTEFFKLAVLMVRESEKDEGRDNEKTVSGTYQLVSVGRTGRAMKTCWAIRMR